MENLNDIWNYIVNAIASTEVTTLNGAFKLFVSMILGGVVGLERKRRGQIAGVRTFALISMGATLAMLLSIYVPQEYLGAKNGDPGRIAAQVITGIGFLGAGAIIQMKGSVRGLTTAAGIWMVATMGMAIGAGLYLLALISTAFILLILVLFERYEQKTNLKWESKIIKMKVNGIITSLAPYKSVLEKHKIHLIDNFVKFDYENNQTVLDFIIISKDNTQFLELFEEIHNKKDIIYISLTNEISI